MSEIKKCVWCHKRKAKTSGAYRGYCTKCAKAIAHVKKTHGGPR